MLGLQLIQEVTERRIQMGRIVLDHVRLKTRIPFVFHGFAKRPVVLICEDINQVRFVKAQRHWLKYKLLCVD
jgi:hypothetical protein